MGEVDQFLVVKKIQKMNISIFTADSKYIYNRALLYARDAFLVELRESKDLILTHNVP